MLFNLLIAGFVDEDRCGGVMETDMELDMPMKRT